jgi:hypothetical protein
MLKTKSTLTPEEEAETRAYLKWEHENSHRVERFEIVGPYTLRLRFDNGVEKVINFQDYLFDPSHKAWGATLRDLDFFNQVYIDDCGMLAWPNRFDFGSPLGAAMLYTWEGDSWKDWLPQP